MNPTLAFIFGSLFGIALSTICYFGIFILVMKMMGVKHTLFPKKTTSIATDKDDETKWRDVP